MPLPVNCPYYIVTKKDGENEYYAYFRSIRLRDSDGNMLDACIFRNNCMKKRKIHFEYVFHDNDAISVKFPEDMNCMVRFRAEMSHEMWNHIERYKAQLIHNAYIKSKG